MRSNYQLTTRITHRHKRACDITKKRNGYQIKHTKTQLEFFRILRVLHSISFTIEIVLTSEHNHRNSKCRALTEIESAANVRKRVMRKNVWTFHWIVHRAIVVDNIKFIVRCVWQFVGLYIDNGIDQTVMHRALTQDDAQEVEHEILELLGLPERPRKKHNIHPSLR